MGKNLRNLTYNTFLVILGVPKNIFIFQIQFGNCHVTFRIKDSASETWHIDLFKLSLNVQLFSGWQLIRGQWGILGGNELYFGKHFSSASNYRKSGCCIAPSFLNLAFLNGLLAFLSANKMESFL